MHSLTVEQLVVHLREVSRQEASPYCEEIIRRFEPLLRRAWRRAALGVEYQDFVQEVFVRLFGGLHWLREPKAFPGYLRKIALSTAADQLRKSRAKPSEGLPEIEEMVARLDEQILTRIFVRSYLELLPSREREVLTLEFFHENSVKEIAALLGIRPGTVRMTKARALKRLRAILLSEAQALEGSSAKA